MVVGVAKVCLGEATMPVLMHNNLSSKINSIKSKQLVIIYQKTDIYESTDIFLMSLQL